MSHALDLLEQRTLDAMLSASTHEERLRNILQSHVRLITELEDGALTILVVTERNALRPEDRRIIEQRVQTYTALIRATLEGLRAAGRCEIDSVATMTPPGLIDLPLVPPGGRLTGDEIATSRRYRHVLGAARACRAAGDRALPPTERRGLECCPRPPLAAAASGRPRRRPPGVRP
jgi:hypothetical protein